MTLYLRKAVEEDRDLLYEWVNDSEVRKNAFQTEKIPYDTHVAWYAKAMKDKNILQYILEKKRRERKKKSGKFV